MAAPDFTACAKRRDRLSSQLEASGLDALVVAHPQDIRYLTGFVGDDSLLIVGGEEAAIVTDARHDELLEPWRAAGACRIVIGKRHRLEQSAAGLLGRGRVGVQAEHLTIAHRARLAENLAGVEIVETLGLVGCLRRVKDEDEIAAIERAAAIQVDALQAALGRLEAGATEVGLCAALEYEMRTRGAQGPSFTTMVATGARSSVIHHQSGDVPIGPGALLIDWGAVVDGYCSDMTRTFGVGGLPAGLREVYEIVLEAQQAAIDGCRPGRTCAEIDAIARDLIAAAGYGEHFGHGLGHGLGIDIHEDPYFNDLATDVVLEPGMVMTVEPGIYLPGTGGVRIEDDVVITAGGCRLLTSWPKDPADADLEPAGRARGAIHA